MNTTGRALKLRSSVAWVCLGAAVSLLVSCAPKEDPRITKAEQVLVEIPAQNPQFEQYALDVASRSTSDFTEKIIIENLSATDYQTAYAAAKAAARRPSAALQEPLKALFASKGGVVKVEAAHALASLGDEEAAQWLRDNVVDSTGAPNAAAIRALADLGELDAIHQALNDGLGSDDQAQRDQVYMILGEIDEPWATELILAGFDKERGESRREAIVALGKKGDPVLSAKVAKFVNTQGLVFVSLAALGDLGNEESIPTVKKMLQRSEKPVQVYSAVALWKLGQAEPAKKVIGELFQDPDPQVRLNLAEQLATVSDRDALSFLATLAEDDDPAVRKEAVRALRERAEPGLEEILVERLTDQDYQVVSLALDALAMVGSRRSIEPIVPLMDHENPYVAISAANAVLEIVARVGEEQPPA